jgi:hypothetical protein
MLEGGNFKPDKNYLKKENVYKTTISKLMKLMGKARTIRIFFFFYPASQTNVFPEKELRGHSLNFHMHVSVSDLYIPTFGPTLFSSSRIGRPIR